METSVSKKYEFILDLDKGYQSTSLTLIQASNNVRKFEVQLTKEELPFDLTNCVVKAMYSKSDDTMVLNNVVVVNAQEGHIQVGLTEQCLSEEGRVRCEIIVIDVLNESFITFPTFVFKAKASLFASSGIESKDEFLTLTEAIVKVENFDVVGQEKLDKLDQQLEVAQGKVDEFQLLHLMASETIDEIVAMEQVATSKTNLVIDKESKVGDIYKRLIKVEADTQQLHNQIMDYESQSLVNKTKIDSYENDTNLTKTKIEQTYNNVVNNEVDSKTSLTRTKAIAIESETLLKTITDRSNNANGWSTSINNVLTNSTSRYNEIVKLKGDSMNALSDILYNSSLSELELKSMQDKFNAKMQEFEDRFNELINRL